MDLQDVQELTNFFERRVSAYQVGVSGEVGDAGLRARPQGRADAARRGPRGRGERGPRGRGVSRGALSPRDMRRLAG
jgi:hypothetical protein